MSSGHRRRKNIEYVRLGVGLGVLLLRRLDLSPDNVLPHIVLLAKVEELPDLRRPLRAQPLRQHVIRQPRDLFIALLDNDQAEHSDIRADDASPNGLALALAGAAGAVAGVAVGEEEADTVREEDALLHGEALLVVAAGDAEDVALPFVADGVGGDFLSDALVEEDAEAALLIEVDGFLFASGGVCDVELHARDIQSVKSQVKVVPRAYMSD